MKTVGGAKTHQATENHCLCFWLFHVSIRLCNWPINFSMGRLFFGFVDKIFRNAWPWVNIRNYITSRRGDLGIEQFVSYRNSKIQILLNCPSNLAFLREPSDTSP